jgi:hypothetical protein
VIRYGQTVAIIEYRRAGGGWSQYLKATVRTTLEAAEGLPSADKELGGVGQGGLVYASGEHAGELPATLLALDALYARDRAPARLFFFDDDVCARF